MNKIKNNKLFAVVLAISSVVIIAGIILYALLGFNLLPERPEKYTFEVHYDVNIALGKEEDLAKLCEDAFKENGISYEDKEFIVYMDGSSLAETTDSMLKYTIRGTADGDALAKAAEAVNASAKTQFDGATVFASMHKLEGTRFYEYAWRGAIAVAVGAIVAYIYICIRYGVSVAVAGITCCAHDALFTAAFFAVTRFPVYAGTPLLFAAVAALASIVLWLVFANKLRDAFKAPENEGVPSEEIIRRTAKEARKPMLISAAVMGGVIVVLGAVAASGASLFLLPAIVGAAVPLLSTFFIGPEICIPLRKMFDKRREKKNSKPGYIGKKKKASENADAE